MNNAQMPAYPCREDWDEGLTKREYAAIELMKPILASSKAASEADLPKLYDICANMAVNAADALLARLSVRIER